MSTSDKILVFTEMDIDDINRCPSFRNNDKVIIKFTPKPQEFYDCLDTGNYSLILIDSENRLSPDNLLNLIHQSIKKRIPIVISNLQTEICDEIIKNNDDGKSSRKSLTLYRKWPEPEPTEKKNLQLITETTATLCHEINNPLMTISANIEVLLDKNTHLSDDVIRKIRLIDHAAERIKDATDKLIQLDSIYYKETIAGRMINLDNSNKSRKVKLSEIG